MKRNISLVRINGQIRTVNLEASDNSLTYTKNLEKDVKYSDCRY